MTVIATPLGEGPAIGILRFLTEEAGLLPIPGHTIPAQVIEVGSERRGRPAVPHHTRLDHRAARAGGDQAIGLNTGALTAPEAGPIARGDAPGPRDATPSLFRGSQSLCDEGPGLLRPGRADTPRADAELAIIGHMKSPHSAKQRKRSEC